MITRIFAAISGVGLFFLSILFNFTVGALKMQLGSSVIGWSAYVVIMIFVVVLGAIGIMLTVWACTPRRV